VVVLFVEIYSMYSNLLKGLQKLIWMMPYVVHSGEWQRHLEHITTFLLTMREYGITLKLKKCQFALPEIKFCGQLVGSGTRRADPDKISAIKKLVVPATKNKFAI